MANTARRCRGSAPPLALAVLLLLVVLPRAVVSQRAQSSPSSAREAVEVADLDGLLEALSDPSVSDILTPAVLEGSLSAEQAVEVARPVLIKPSDAAGETVWRQNGAEGVVSVLKDGSVTVEGRVTFTGCSAPSEALSSCRFSPYLPGVFGINGGEVSLNGTQLVCQDPHDLVTDPEAVTQLLSNDTGFQTAELEAVGSRKVLLKDVSGCASSSPDQGAWNLKDVSAVWDAPGCYQRGSVVATGSELHEALNDDLPGGLKNPVSNVYIVESIKMLEADWPKTNVSREVNVTGCGGVVWDTNLIGQVIFVWSGGHMSVDGIDGNFTVANSKASSRRGNAWQLVGAWSAETGNITLKNLTVTSTDASPFHSVEVDLNPPRNWPLPCCTIGEFDHLSPTRMLMKYWRMDKAEWVLASAGVQLTENAFWNFYNVVADVKAKEPCFQDYSVGVSNARQFYDALDDPELLHIELLASMDLQDWAQSVTVSRPGVIVRGCRDKGAEPYAISFPTDGNLIHVHGMGGLTFDGDILIAFEEPRVLDFDLADHDSDALRPFMLDDGGVMSFDSIILDCRFSASCMIGDGLQDAADDPNVAALGGGLYRVSSLDVPYTSGDGTHNGLFEFRNVLAQLATKVVEPEGGVDTRIIIGAAASALALAAVLAACIFAMVKRTSASRRSNEESSKGMIGGSENGLSIGSHSSKSVSGHAALLHGKLGSGLVSAADDKVQILELLGSGGSAKVYRGNWKGVVVAYKVIQLPAMAEEQGQSDQKEKFEAEASISVALRHPNVVQTFSYKLHPVERAMSVARSADSQVQGMSSGENLANVNDSKTSQISAGGEEETQVVLYEANIIQEYCNKGSLFAALASGRLPGQEGRNTRPNTAVALQLALDVACGMHHIHSLQIIHGDLKAQNVLLTAHDRSNIGLHLIAKVADFGLSWAMDSAQTHVSNVHSGTITHMSPELMLTGALAKPADVYAFGILMFELFTGKKVFDNQTAVTISRNVVQKKIRPQFPPDTHVMVVDLACQCWDDNPDVRPTFSEVMTRLEGLKPTFGIIDDETSSLASEGSAPRTRRKSTADGSVNSSVDEPRHSGFDMKTLQMQGGSTGSLTCTKSKPRKTNSGSASSPLSVAHVVEEEDDDDDDDDDDGDNEEGKTIIWDPTSLIARV